MIGKTMLTAGASVIMVASATVVQAQPESPWGQLTIADVATIHDSVQSIHPGMRDPQNPAFATDSDRAYREALDRAATARSFLDWRSTVGGFIQSFRDGHTFIRYNAQPSRVRWPGFLIDGRGGGYVAAGVAPDAGVADGDRLIACDGVPIETLLKDRLDAREADWSKPPERIRQAWRLFVDYDVDAPLPIRNCQIEHGGTTSSVSLAWREGFSPDLIAQSAPLQRTPVGERPVTLNFLADDAALIRIGSFGDEAKLGTLEKTLIAAKERLRAAPYVVFDLRGNRGGNSTWGGVYARILFGDAAVGALGEPASGKYFRASPAAVVRLRLIAKEFRGGGPAMAQVADYWTKIADRVAASPDGDARLFTDFVNRPVKKSRHPPVSAYRGPVYVLTDAGCFSSCVVAANILIKLGGINVGEVMGQNEEYGEITGPLALPSGLGRYWLPISIIRQRQEDLGGRPVAHAWNGAMSDDPGILAWIATLATGERAKPHDDEPRELGLSVNLATATSRIGVTASVRGLSCTGGTARVWLNRGLTVESARVDGRAVTPVLDAPGAGRIFLSAARSIDLPCPRETAELRYAGPGLLQPDGRNQVSPEYIELSYYGAWYPLAADERRPAWRLRTRLPRGWTYASNGRVASARRDLTIESQGQSDVVLVASPRFAAAPEHEGARVLISSKAPATARATAAALGHEAAATAVWLSSVLGPSGARSGPVLVFAPRSGPLSYARLPIIVTPHADLDAPGDRPLALNIRHEVAHFWSRAVGPANDWINEGLAEYLALLRTRDQDGEVAYQSRMAIYRDQVQVAGSGVPIAATYADETRGYVNRYQRPALLMDALERTVGRPAVERFLRRLFTLGPAQTTASFVTLGGEDLGAEQGARAAACLAARDWPERCGGAAVR